MASDTPRRRTVPARSGVPSAKPSRIQPAITNDVTDATGIPMAKATPTTTASIRLPIAALVRPALSSIAAGAPTSRAKATSGRSSLAPTTTATATSR